MNQAPRPSKQSLLAVITESYPYAGALEQTFVEPQLAYLAQRFGQVVIVPQKRLGRRLMPPTEVDVEESLSASIAEGFSLADLPALSGGVPKGQLELAITRGPRAIARLARTGARAAIIVRWMERFVNDHGAHDVTFYSSWSDASAIAAGIVRKSHRGVAAACRVNGYDFIEERQTPPYLPWRPFVYAAQDKVLAGSEFAARYLAHKYPAIADRIVVSRLGVHDPGFETDPPEQGRCVLVSCSAVVALKRVDLIARGVERAARRRRGVEFEWHHIGEGPLRDDVRRLADDIFPANATAHLHGHLDPDEVLGFYQTARVTAFVHLSASEGGTPVAAMEAASCGIPLIASDNGGTREIMSGANGVLLGSAPTAEEVGGAIAGLIEAPHEMRSASRSVWATKFRASTNYAALAGELTEISQTRHT